MGDVIMGKAIGYYVQILVFASLFSIILMATSVSSANDVTSQNCRMYAAISDNFPNGLIEKDLVTDQYSLRNMSKEVDTTPGSTELSYNINGWGFATYNSFDGPSIIYRGEVRAYNDLNYTVRVSQLNSAEPKIILAHVRHCTSGCCTPYETVENPHPFVRIKNNKTWTFAHNGGVPKSTMVNLIGTTYLNANGPFGSGVSECVTSNPNANIVVDSELYFLYILKTIEDNNWDDVRGITSALKSMNSGGAAGGSINFIMSDGEVVYGFSKGNEMSYKYDAVSGYSAVASVPPNSSESGWVTMNDWQLVILNKNQPPVVINDVRSYVSQAPQISSINPADLSIVQSPISKMSFQLNDPNNLKMNYAVTTSPDIGSANANNIQSGLISMNVSGLVSGTTYFVTINVSDMIYSVQNNYSFNYTVLQQSPQITAVSPSDGEVLFTAPTRLRFNLNDINNDVMSYQLTTSPNIGSAAASVFTNGIYNATITGVLPGTYFWTVNASDGSSLSQKTFSFTYQSLQGDMIVSNAYPNNQDSNYNPRLSVKLDDPQNRPLTVIFETNQSGNWVQVGITQYGSDGTYVQDTSHLDIKGQRYYWRVRSYNGVSWTIKTYYFIAVPFVLKWSYNTNANTSLGPLAVDVNGDGVYEVFTTGEDKITCLDGATGNLIWQYTNSKIFWHSPFQIHDLNNDGIPEVVIPAVVRTIALHANNGSVYWNVPVESEEKHIVIVDTDGNGYPYVYTTSEDVEHMENGTGRLRKLNGTNGQVIKEVFSWRPCWGGLSADDVNNDGKFEIYMTDRSAYYHPPSLGKGMQAYDADTLDLLWYDDEVLCSSHMMALIDVNNDSIKDIVALNQGLGTAGIIIHDGLTNQRMTGKWNMNLGLSSHSPFSIWDVDGDGNLELVTAREGSTAKVWDIGRWQLDATLDATFDEPPKMADVIGDSHLEIIGGGADTKIYDGVSYQRIETIPTGNAIDSTLVQDIDNDGQNELITISSVGLVKAYDTSAYAPTPRVRTNALYYGEQALGAGVYIPPPGAPQPFIKDEYPVDSSQDVSLNPVLSIHAVDYRHDLMDIEFSIYSEGDWKTVASIKNATNGEYSYSPTEMNETDTEYTWRVTATDPSADKIVTSKTFHFTTTAGESWSMPNWSRRKSITINHAKVAAVQYNYSMMIDINDLALAANTQNDGDDILFTAADGQTVLDHEIESYNSSTGHLVAWVRMPTLSPVTDTLIYIYYGNSNSGSQQNSGGVWDLNYLAVHHLDENSGVSEDSTSYSNDGTPLNGVVQDVLGKIDGADQFDGSNDQVVLPQLFTGQNQFTFEAWVNSDSKQGYVMSQRDSSSHGAFLQYNPNTFQLYADNKYIYKTASAGNWHYVAGTYNGGTISLFVDAGAPVTSTATLTWPALQTILGDRSTGSRAFKGKLDEIRISGIARSQDYIQTNYNIQSDPSGSIVVGPEELAASKPIISDEYPVDSAINIPLSLSTVHFNLKDALGNLMSYSVMTSPDIGSSANASVGDGTYALSVSGLASGTKYTWYVNVSDGYKSASKQFEFTTETVKPKLLADNEFDTSNNSADLIANGAGQDWYESRAMTPSLLTLDINNISGNAGKKTRLSGTTATSQNAYLSQEFSSSQNNSFSVQWDVLVESIVNATPHRAGMMLIGDDTNSSAPGPNSNDNERFVYVGFSSLGKASGKMDLVARDRNDAFTEGSFTVVATDLNLGQWYNIRVDLNLTSDMYDVYVDGTKKATVTSRYAKNNVTHISFATWNDGAGTFYIDNVKEYAPVVCFDGDGDGFSITGGECGQIDCNDANVNIHPFAIESCNGNDDDCSAATADGSGEVPPLNTKQQGVCSGSTKVCAAGVWTDNYTGIANYNDPETSCDLLDNDCNGTADDGLTTNFYQDFDADTYGNGLVSQLTCMQPAGYVIDKSDCDDTKFTVHPGASEICNDSIDNNCNAQIDEGCSVWPVQGWNFRKKITLNSSKVSGGLTDFPVLLDFTDSNVSIFAQSNGNDIFFTKEDGVTKLAHEIEAYSNGHVVAWLKTDLSSSKDTIIYMYFGNLAAASQETPEAVWDSSFLAVQHLEETSGTSEDSTSQNNDGAPLNGVVQGIASKIDGGAQFDGSNDNIRMPQVLTNQNQFTFEVWINSANKQGYAISQRDGASNGAFLQYYSNTFQFYSNSKYVIKSSTANAWHYVVGTFDGSNIRLYVDAGTPVTNASTVTWPAQAMYIGDRSAGGRALQGTLDEVRVSNIARSQDYIKTSFNNQNNPASFIKIGLQESNGASCTNSTQCDDGLMCNGLEACTNNMCSAGTPVNCSANNILGVANCSNIPVDTNPLTWDFRNLFISTCQEPTGICTFGNLTVSHTCDVTQCCDVQDCSAFCDATHNCKDTVCVNQSGCVGPDYHQYTNVSNTCLNDCACTNNACSAPLILPNDSRCVVCVDNDADGINATGAGCGPVDCDDANANVNPGAVELCGNGIDDNCDGIDDTCPVTSLIVDSDFSASADSADLRVNGVGQDWYESRAQSPTLLTLDNNIGGHTGQTARLSGTNISTQNAYLTQEFSASQTGFVTLSWDVFVESIFDSAPHRVGMMLVGDDTVSTTLGPNSDNNERFVYMGFSSYGKASGKMDLVARDRDDAFTEGSFTVVAADLSIGHWYNIRVDLNLSSDTYDVYVDGIKKGTVTSRNIKDSVSYVSFAQWNDGAGTFYVDNVYSPAQAYIPPVCVDADGDGYGANCALGVDCDDNNSAVHPGAPETCNGIDDNCNSQVDEGVMTTFFQDADLDSFGNSAASQQSCSKPLGYVTDNTDCNDADTNIRPGATETCNTIDDNCNGQADEGVTSTFYQDSDGDTYGNIAVSEQACTPSGGYVANSGDCNDNVAAINPGSLEVCDGFDNNCNGQTDEGSVCGATNYYCDTDSDSYLSLTVSGSCNASNCVPNGCAITQGNDCNDADSSVNPGAVETCNGVDDNCDGNTDESLLLTFYQDLDVDTYGNSLVSQQACSAPSGYTSDSTDCNDANGTVHPGAVEVCGNGIDENCDGKDDMCPLLADSTFDASSDSTDLENNGLGQDWYESRGQNKSKLVLDSSDVGGNAGNKAQIIAGINSAQDNIYMSQEFSTPQTGIFSVQWDIYVDQILDTSGTEDKGAFMTIGDDSGGTNGPCSTGAERFMYLSFNKTGGATTGPVSLARKTMSGTTTVTTTIGTLNLDQWYTMKATLNLDTDTYDLNVTQNGDQVLYVPNIPAATAKTSVTHVSFSTWNDGAATFYVDNVYSPSII
jgi:predicted glutamine amidotransferase